MHSRDSRYRHVEEMLRTDALGRELMVTDLRRRPVRGGPYRHTVIDGDRLDHLGQRYYRRPHRWWEICDGNPAELSPLGLIGQEPLRTVRITAETDGTAWHAVLADLRALPGVEGAVLETDGRLAVLTVRFNELSVAATTLAGVVAGHGLEPGLAVSPTPVGAPIVVPPQTSRP
jgi:hypothetical protein